MGGRAATFVSRSCAVAALALASCFPDYRVGGAAGPGADGGVNDASASDATTDSGTADTDSGGTEAGADAGGGEGGGGGDSGGDDAGALPVVPGCGDMSGLQPNAPWPMQ